MSGSIRIVVGWHSCVEAIKVRPHQITKVYVEDQVKTQSKGSETSAPKKGGKPNRFKSGSSAQNKSFEKPVEQSPQNTSRMDFLNQKSIKNKIQMKPKSFFEKWGTGHQGIAVEIESDEPTLDYGLLDNKKSVLVALDEIEDPTNLGNLLRTSWLLGVDGLLITQDRSVKLTPQVCKIASGGAEHVPVEVVHPLSNTLEDFKKQGFWVYGLDANAEQTIYDVQFPDKVILVAGNEGKGLRKTTLNVCDQLLKIPQVSDVASLNVATSLAITLSHVQRAFLSVDDNKLKK